ncbi:MAG: NADH:flavin oxidoreductase [Acidiferrobacterales bacterium]|nr:NADH:flavin oxidoreductase [Acidiferrobacterales bacterium]
MKPKSDPLLEPFQLKHLHLRNRIISTSHEPSYSEDMLPKLRYQLYHEEKAKGGIALTMFGGSTLVDRDSPPAFGNLYAGSDEIVPYFRQLADRVHQYGTAVMCQITHLGRRTSPYVNDWLPTVAASCVREPAHRSFPKELEIEDISRIAKAYGAAARRCVDGDLDGIEIEGYGHLLDGFWARRTNRRTDRYGGSLDNRIRFTVEVIDEIRNQVGSDFIVGIRMVIDEDLADGLEFEEGMQIAQILTDTGKLDFINVIKGHVDTDEGLSHVIPNMGTPSGPHLEFTAAVRSALKLPVFHAARIADVATARHAVASGCVDLVGMTRAHMADPHIVSKIEQGAEDQIRPCVGAGYCIDRIYMGGEALCIHNPATGREGQIPHIVPPSRTHRRVVVVGAGPAGLEAARVCSERGHDVVLFEAADQPGGQLNTAARVERRREILGVTDWLYGQLQRLSVEMRFNHYAEAGDVIQENPDVVIVATGGSPNLTFLKYGADCVTTTWDVLDGAATLHDDVLIYDDNGQHQAISCAEFLIRRGSTVRFATPDRQIAEEVGGTNYPVYYKLFYENNVEMIVSQRLIGAQRKDGTLVGHFYNEFDRSATQIEASQIVVEHGTLPNDELYFDLKRDSLNHGIIDFDALVNGTPQNTVANPDGNYQLFRVGDAVASRNIYAALYDSIRLCLQI